MTKRYLKVLAQHTQMIKLLFNNNLLSWKRNFLLVHRINRLKKRNVEEYVLSGGLRRGEHGAGGAAKDGRVKYCICGGGLRRGVRRAGGWPSRLAVWTEVGTNPFF